MSTRTTSASIALAVTTLALGLAGCADDLPAGTVRAASPTAAGPGEVLVTFVRPESSCDTGEYAVVVDEHGRFVANVVAGTNVSYSTTPGPHAFYAWSNVDLHIDKEQSFNPVAAVRVNVEGTEPQYVALEVATPCGARANFDLHQVKRTSAAWAEVQGWLASTTPVTVDRKAGQALLEARPAHLRNALEFGMAKLRRSHEADARRARYEATQREDSVD